MSFSAKELVAKYVDYVKEKSKHGFNPVTALDYSSLYPSLIMTYNLSPEYLIVDEEKKDYFISKGYPIHEIEFTYNYEDAYQNQRSKIIKGWTIRHDESKEDSRFGLYPEVLRNLFKMRAEMKKSLEIYKDKKEEMEKEFADRRASKEEMANDKEYQDCMFNFNYCDTKQKALKVYMNCFYGELGNKNSPLFILELAGGITSAGQSNLRKVKKFIEDKGCKTYYGDSVSADTPVYISKDCKKDVISVEELFKTYENSSYLDSNTMTKEIIEIGHLGLDVISETGWTKIKKIIRHKTDKEMYRVTTHLGSVIVTEDHSLLDNHGKIIKPNDCNLNTKLLHWYSTERPEITNDSIRVVDYNNINDLYLVYGFFYGDGSCGYYNCSSGSKYSFALNNSNRDYLVILVNIFNNYYSTVKLKIVNTLESSGVYKANAIGNVKDLVIEWRKLFYSGNYKKVPSQVFNSSNDKKLNFLRGYYMADGDRKFNRFCNKGQIGTQGLIVLLHDLGFKTSTNIREDKVDIYRTTFTLNKQRKCGEYIKKIEHLGKCEGYVYDLETETHHFGAGVGQIVVHNTDSLYFTFHDDEFIDIHKQYFLSNYKLTLTKEEYCTQLVNKTFTLVKDMSQKVNDFLKSDNGTRYLKMAYEEVLYPVVFLSRKKYYGIAHEKIVNFKPKKMFIRGLEVKKRGVSEILRIICLETMWQSMDINNYKTLREMVMDKIDYLYSKDWKMEEFVQTGLWKPNKKNQTLIRYIERVIAEGRDPPDAYERFNYVIVKIKDPLRLYDFKGRKVDIKKGDKMEYLEYAKEKGMEIDLDYYFEKQLTGQFARLISYDEEFHVYTITDWKEDEEVEIEDTKTMRLCRKFIKDYASKWSSGYSDMANVYKEVFRSANRVISGEMASIISNDNKLKSMLMETQMDYIDNLETDYRRVVESRVLNVMATSCMKRTVKENAKSIVKDLKSKKSNVTKMFSDKHTSYRAKMKNILNQNKERKIMEYITFVKDNGLEEYIFVSSEDTIKPVINKIRQQIDITKYKPGETIDVDKVVRDTMMKRMKDEGDIEKVREGLKKAYNIFINIVSIYKNIQLYEEIQTENIQTITKRSAPLHIAGFRLEDK